MNIQIRKQALRQSIIAAREKLPARDRLRANRAIVGTLHGLSACREAATVLGYLNFGAELEAEHWVERMLEDGKRVLLPRVNRDSKQLELHVVQDLRQDVAPGAFGIREPLPQRCARFTALDELEFILLPGVAFTREGARLGYGGGFYDKLLASLPHQPVLAAGAFAMQVVDQLPQEPFDRRVDWLITELETICCNLGRG